MFKKPVLPEVERVQLKSWKGLRPGVYILLSLGLAAILLAFLLFVLPGLASKTAYVSFVSPLPQLGVYEDGVYLGNASGSVLKTTSGKHTYTYTIQGIEVGKAEETVKNKVFFTLFSHKPSLLLPVVEEKGDLWKRIEDDFASRIAVYSQVREFDSSYNYPPLFQNLASYAAYFGKDITSLWLYGAMHITSEAMQEDYLKGRSILDEARVSYSSEKLKTIETTVQGLLDAGSVSVLSSDNTSPIEAKAEGNYYSYKKGTITLGNTTREASMMDAHMMPATVEYDEFSIGATVVTEYDYALFIASNPYWAKSNVENLIKDGMVEEHYLDGVTLSTVLKSRRPVRNISWYAAKAYTEWLSSSTGVSFRLPTEAEWTVAARSGENKPYATSLTYTEKEPKSPENMMGQVWEFTETPFVPFGRFNYDEALSLSETYGNPYVIVKGGSYVNDSSSITTETVGVMSKSNVSEFCGFRVVIDG